LRFPFYVAGSAGFYITVAVLVHTHTAPHCRAPTHRLVTRLHVHCYTLYVTTTFCGYAFCHTHGWFTFTVSFTPHYTRLRSGSHTTVYAVSRRTRLHVYTHTFTCVYWLRTRLPRTARLHHVLPGLHALHCTHRTDFTFGYGLVYVTAARSSTVAFTFRIGSVYGLRLPRLRYRLPVAVTVGFGYLHVTFYGLPHHTLVYGYGCYTLPPRFCRLVTLRLPVHAPTHTLPHCLRFGSGWFRLPHVCTVWFPVATVPVAVTVTVHAVTFTGCYTFYCRLLVCRTFGLHLLPHAVTTVGSMRYRGYLHVWVTTHGLRFTRFYYCARLRSAVWLPHFAHTVRLVLVIRLHYLPLRLVTRLPHAHYLIHHAAFGSAYYTHTTHGCLPVVRFYAVAVTTFTHVAYTRLRWFVGYTHCGLRHHHTAVYTCLPLVGYTVTTRITALRLDCTFVTVLRLHGWVTHRLRFTACSFVGWTTVAFAAHFAGILPLRSLHRLLVTYGSTFAFYDFTHYGCTFTIPCVTTCRSAGLHVTTVTHTLPFYAHTHVHTALRTVARYAVTLPTHVYLRYTHTRLRLVSRLPHARFTRLRYTHTYTRLVYTRCTHYTLRLDWLVGSVTLPPVAFVVTFTHVTTHFTFCRLHTFRTVTALRYGPVALRWFTDYVYTTRLDCVYGYGYTGWFTLRLRFTRSGYARYGLLLHVLYTTFTHITHGWVTDLDTRFTFTHFTFGCCGCYGLRLHTFTHYHVVTPFTLLRCCVDLRLLHVLILRYHTSLFDSFTRWILRLRFYVLYAFYTRLDLLLRFVGLRVVRLRYVYVPLRYVTHYGLRFTFVPRLRYTFSFGLLRLHVYAFTFDLHTVCCTFGFCYVYVLRLRLRYGCVWMLHTPAFTFYGYVVTHVHYGLHYVTGLVRLHTQLVTTRLDCGLVYAFTFTRLHAVVTVVITCVCLRAVYGWLPHARLRLLRLHRTRHARFTVRVHTFCVCYVGYGSGCVTVPLGLRLRLRLRFTTRLRFTHARYVFTQFRHTVYARSFTHTLRLVARCGWLRLRLFTVGYHYMRFTLRTHTYTAHTRIAVCLHTLRFVVPRYVTHAARLVYVWCSTTTRLRCYVTLHVTLGFTRLPAYARVYHCTPRTHVSFTHTRYGWIRTHRLLPLPLRLRTFVYTDYVHARSFTFAVGCCSFPTFYVGSVTVYARSVTILRLRLFPVTGCHTLVRLVYRLLRFGYVRSVTVGLRLRCSTFGYRLRWFTLALLHTVRYVCCTRVCRCLPHGCLHTFAVAGCTLLRSHFVLRCGLRLFTPTRYHTPFLPFGCYTHVYVVWICVYAFGSGFCGTRFTAFTVRSQFWFYHHTVPVRIPSSFSQLIRVRFYS